VVDFLMPSLGADMEAGTLVEWLVKPGDRVKRGDVVAVVETQKGAIEIETFQAGQIEQILVELKSKVPVGTPLARIRTDGEAKPAAVVAAPLPIAPAPAAAAPPAAPAVERPPVTPAPPPRLAPATAARARVSPAARKLAEERGIDLSTVTGSGPDGAITSADVERRIGEAAAPPERKRGGLDLAVMRLGIAAAMARSMR
jgi:pyruvate dehydrogenase E2 component (dihydrolipoamide acetyltransferase)